MIKEETPRVRAKTADILYDAFYSGAVGGSIIALFFLLFDVMKGRPFHSPSLIGSTLFMGADPHADVPMRLEMVAATAVITFAAFAAIGFLVAFLEQKLDLHNKRPLKAVLTIFLVNAVFFGAAALFMPGVIAELGVAKMLIANVLAAMGMMLAVSYGHRRGAVRAKRHERAEERVAAINSSRGPATPRV